MLLTAAPMFPTAAPMFPAVAYPVIHNPLFVLMI
jgi:hypothetical protein